MFNKLFTRSFGFCFSALLFVTPNAGAAESTEPICIDLTQYYTAHLTDSLNSPTHVKENNFASLPKGRQLFLKVPFQIGGVVQLSGKKIQEWGRNEFPQAVTNIAIGKNFSRLHLLHGAGGVYDPDGTTIATLTLHYADQSKREIPIITTQHVRDWWGETNQPVTGTNSALAWAGTNPALKQYGGPKPGSLRLYLTTFPNPQPTVAVTSVDYTSAMKDSSPFLIGLTVQ